MARLLNGAITFYTNPTAEDRNELICEYEPYFALF